MINPVFHATPKQQGGIALVVALVLLVALSLLAATTMRNAISTESVNGNVRQYQLAQQAAEAALIYCEDAVQTWAGLSPTGGKFFALPSNPSFSVVLATSMILENTATPISQVATNWDGKLSTNYPLILPLSVVSPLEGMISPNNSNNKTYQRPPECIIERLSPPTASTYNSNFSITARGFGPEVIAADSSRSRPLGSEVWMQSTIELK